jgi:sortase A
MRRLAAPPEASYDEDLSARSTLVYLLKTAASQGILDRDAGPRTAAEIAAAAGGEPGRIAVVCSTLVGYGILDQHGDRFTVSEKYRALLPSEDRSQLTQLLEKEEHKLRAMEAAAGSRRTSEKVKPPAHLVLADLRPEDRREPAGEPNGQPSVAPDEPDELHAQEGDTDASDADSADGDTGRELAAATSRPLVARHTVESASGVKAEVRPPAVPIPARYRHEPPVTPATLASAFVGTWPIGLMGIEVIDRAVRSAIEPRPGKLKRLRYRVGALLWLVAGICVIWAAWDLWGTGLGQADAQKELKSEFTRTLDAAPVVKAPEVPNSVPGDAPAPVAFTDPPPKPLPGSAIALLKIPGIDLEQMILEGTGVRDLRRGPGHYAGTALPGQPGNAAIAGHRTTYGAPFFKVGKLKIGDAMEVTTRTGTYTYRVSRIYRVDPDDSSPLLPSLDNRLTLTTCDPPFSAAKRLIVVGTLVGDPDTQPATVAPRSDPVPSPAPPQPAETTAPGLNLRAIRQPGAVAPSPAPPGAATPAGSTQPAPAPPPAAPAVAPAASPAATQTAQTTPTTQPPAPRTNEDHLNPFLQPQQPPPQVTQPSPAPSPQPQSGSGTLPECSDGIDNDRNGKIDLEDRGCDGDPNEDE